MGSTGRWRVMLLGLAIAGAACATNERSIVCEAEGHIYFCRAGTQCGGAQQLCLEPGGCGNGIVDDGEQCDGGNNISGDGCSDTCQREECGNGHLDPGEQCDDDNTHGGDGCSADCQSKETCGNGIVDKDAGEVCDDGVNDGKGGVTTAKDGDGCNKTCTSTEVCGNHIIDFEVGEVCDDGPGGSAECSATCRSNLSCNNFMVDDGEQCDHGKFGDNNLAGNEDHNDCRSDCQFNLCGDGFIDNQLGPRHEQCDGGHLILDNLNRLVAVPTETAGCNLDCTSAVCGDGKVNKIASEQCDDGNQADNDGCSHNCKSEFCGNGVVDNGEPCDPSVDAPGCNADCTVNACGDGKRNLAAGEQCDDGNIADGDGCSPACRFEHCGNSIVDAHEECDGDEGLKPCNIATCLQERCGNGIRDDDKIHEQCDDGNLTNGDGCSNLCVYEFCGDGKLNNGEVCDPSVTPATCNLDCTSSTCGDGKLNAVAGEQCDDHNTSPDDGCSATCKFESCGDHITQPPEQCDGPGSSPPCSASCHFEQCGNGIVDVDLAVTPAINEQCDLGAANSDNGACLPGCKLARCGDGHTQASVEHCDDGNNEDGDGCSAECRTEFCGNGKIDNGETCDPSVDQTSCNLDCTPSVCGDHKLNRAGGEQCDDHNTAPDDGCSATCQFEHCGDNIVQSPEECDGAADTQPCSPTCHVEVCGNGIVDVDHTVTPAIDEQCDLGASNNDHGQCTTGCKIAKCGDHLLETSAEQCDDGNLDNGDGCSELCVTERCGDGVVNNGELCDPAATPATCNLDCTSSMCGDGKPNAAAGEQCDDDNTDPDDGCSATCQFESCGDHITQSGEECDGPASPLGGTPPCSPSCHFEVCGNGIVDIDAAATPAILEQCDLGAAGNSDTGLCTTSCQIAQCGDHLTEAGVEQCDLGSGNADTGDCTTQCRTNVCGDGLQDTTGNNLEDCDLGPANTDAPACAYNATCLACSSHCHALTVHHQCGDGAVDTPDEVCDDHNTDACGTCSATCGRVTSHQASGLILAVTGAQLADTETFTLDDGINPPLVFEFDTVDGVLAADIAVAFTAGQTAPQVKAAIEAAIQGQHDLGNLLIAPYADPANVNPALVVLRHDRRTALGNHNISSDVVDAGFFVFGMSGGEGGDCNTGVACSTDDDCASFICNSQHVCDGPSPVRAASRLVTSTR